MFKYVIGNWKMNGSVSGTLDFLNLIHTPELGKDGDTKRISSTIKPVICPPFPLLPLFANHLSQSEIALGAQNCSDKLEGAFTGEVSSELLCDFNCTYVILGHSERRQLFGESNDFIKAKVETAQSMGLNTVICVGETLNQRETGQTVETILKQTFACLPESLNPVKTLIAYEPIWAIGTGKVATIDDIAQVHAPLKAALKEKYVVDIPVLYGGSVNSKNSTQLLEHPLINGVLVGGASLKAEEFLQMVK